MHISRVTWARRELALARPIFTARGVMTTREIFLVALRTGEGYVGVGEIAPLPHFGTETSEAAWYAVSSIAARNHFPSPSLAARDLSEWLSRVELDARTLPATYFGFQSALLALLCQCHDVPLYRFFPESRRSHLCVNALVTGSTTEIAFDSAGCAVEAGYTTLKIKVGMRPLPDDIELVARLRAAFPETHLRLDANGAWSLTDAREFCRTVERFDIEYIEDPVQTVSVDALCQLRSASSIPIALDNAARDIPLVLQLLQRRLFDVLILKPATLGAYDLMIDLTGETRRRGVDLVFSSSFESSLGMTYIAHLAVTQGSPKRAHGLGTIPLLDDDTLTAPLRPSQELLRFHDVRELPSLLTEDLQAELEIPFKIS